jgi:hypothetical protein
MVRQPPSHLLRQAKSGVFIPLHVILSPSPYLPVILSEAKDLLSFV